MECLARVSDTQGKIWATGSLGTQYTNPKSHWAYKHFKEKPLEGSACFEWSTADNPFFPREELHRLKDTLDPRTFRQMFEIDWSVPGTALVYDDFSEANCIRGYTYNPNLETYVAIDWGWSHEMACIFMQFDPKTDTVYLFDEIIRSKMKIEELHAQILSRPYRIKEWYCDIAGTQEREQTGISNVQWFKSKGIHFKFRSAGIQHGISIVRSYIKNAKGMIRFYADEGRCPKSVDNLRNYSYPQKNGVVTNENPIKKDDDAVDAIRYYFHLRHDTLLKPNAPAILSR